MSNPKIETAMRVAFADALVKATSKPGVSPVELSIYSALKRGVGRTDRRQWWSVQRGIR